ncbi:CsbD family protein [Loigolactobacillus binensis]|uniref:CsbD family protein n=1 Tax=Loigolactobacillus binensis TaxID=2559922 RepID=A0ABW3EA53_9LACO|nr:CsbD family protein [Loigolactobacillus binensis]
MASKMDKLKGKLKEAAGKVANNDELETKGQLEQEQAKAKEKAKHLAEVKTQEKRAKLQRAAKTDDDQ